MKFVSFLGRNKQVTFYNLEMEVFLNMFKTFFFNPSSKIKSRFDFKKTKDLTS